MTIKNFLFIFAVALIIRVVYAWFFVEASNLILEDQTLYIQLGKTIAETGNFLQTTNHGYTAVTARLPGYPALLSVVYTLFGENNMAVVGVQILIDSLTCVVIGLIAESVMSRGFLVAGLISALNLNMIILSGMILTDTLFLFLFSLFILFAFYYLKHPAKLHIFYSVSFLSLATLVRPVSYFLIPLLLLLLIAGLIQRKIKLKKILHTVLIYLIPVVIVFGATHYRNYDQYGSFSLVSQGGTHTLNWIVPAVYQYSGEGSYQDGLTFAKNHLENTMNADGLLELPSNPFKKSDYQMRVAREALTELGLLNMMHAWTVGAVINFLSPSAAFAPIVREMEHPSFYATPGYGVVEKLINYVTSTNGLVYLIIIISGTLISFIFIVASLAGLYSILKSDPSSEQKNAILILSVFLIVYFLAITGPIVGVKYRLPLEPIMVLYVAHLVSNYLKKKINK